MDSATLDALIFPVALGRVLARGVPRGAHSTRPAQSWGRLTGPCPGALGWRPPTSRQGSVISNTAESWTPLSISQAEAAVYPAPGSPLLWVGIFSVQHRNVGYSMLSRNST